jgi:tetratricopeptide (TPR) repeat protein
VGNNVNVGNTVNVGSGNFNNFNGIGNRPGWDYGRWNSGAWNNPNWGWGYPRSWAGNWHDNCINPSYGWYNGCWNGGYWGSNWYQPLAWGAVGWGLASWTNGWGYGSGYYNPYYVQPTAVTVAPYDYSQQVIVTSYAMPDAGDVSSAPVTAEATASELATEKFNEGLALFRSGDYEAALAAFDAALAKLPGDPVVHEVRALALFAIGDYKAAAAALNALLSSAPGMDWTTMSGLYGKVDDYSEQLARLEAFTEANPNDAASHFVVAYHALVIDDKQAAIEALKVVVKNQSKDSTAKRMLDALAPAPAPTLPPATTSADIDPPETDLVGVWQAKAGDTTIELTITKDSQFTWKATPAGKPPVELKGQLESNSDAISLDTKDQGSMAGTVQSLGADQWKFLLSGAPASDPGLAFTRQPVASPN